MATGPQANPVVIWNPPISEIMNLWHGCTERNWKKIQANGLDLSACRAQTDFGRGFYLTTNQNQAKGWANIQSGRGGRTGRAAVLNFKMLRSTLARQESLSFVRCDTAFMDYWLFVQHCRNSNNATTHMYKVGNPAFAGWYDVVSGPVAKNWTNKTSHKGYDQFSFHTANSVAMLQSMINSNDTDQFEVAII